MKKIERYSAPAAWMMALALTAGLAACDSGSDPILGGSGTSGALLPTVAITQPLATSPIVTGVPVASNVTVTFSKDMDASTINESTILLACPASAPVSAVVTYVAETRVATLNPNAALPFSTVCSASVTTAAMDTTGRALANDFNWSFATAPAPGTPPTVIGTQPMASTPIVTGVPTTSNVTVTFSKDMNAGTIDESSVLLACPATAPVTGVVSYVAGTRVATLNPNADLPAGTVCTATVTTAVMDTTGLAMTSNFVWRFATAAVADVTRPTALLHMPASGALNVARNARISVTFSEAMNAATFVPSSFTVTGPGVTPVTGTVSFDPVSKVAIFTPTTPALLLAATQYTATVSRTVTDLAGNELAGNPAMLPASSDHVWTFTTAAAADTTAPLITQVTPANGATMQCLQKDVQAVFDEPMDALTLTTASFTVQKSGPPLGAALAGAVTYNAATETATFNPTLAFEANTQYTATVTTAAEDTAGNALAAARVWTFTTGGQACAPMAPVAVGTVQPFGSVGGTAGTTNTGILTIIGGDISTTATSTSSITGLHDSAGDIYTQTGSNQGTVTGKIYSCTVSTLGPTSAAVNAASCSIAEQALIDAQSSFDSLAPAVLPGGTDPGAGQLGGLTLAPGVYKAAGGSFLITGSDLTLDGQGDPNAVWVFQSASTLDVGAPGAPRSVILINGANAKNVFWHVGTSATINAAGGGTMVGTILASSAVSFSTVGNVALVTLNGRAVGLNASVTMTNTIINVPAP